jgi:hypothetical protein
VGRLASPIVPFRGVLAARLNTRMRWLSLPCPRTNGRDAAAPQGVAAPTIRATTTAPATALAMRPNRYPGYDPLAVAASAFGGLAAVQVPATIATGLVAVSVGLRMLP